MTLSVTQTVQDQKVRKSLTNGLELVCTKAVMTWFVVVPWYTPGKTKENHENLRIAIQTKIWTPDLLHIYACMYVCMHEECLHRFSTWREKLSPKSYIKSRIVDYAQKNSLKHHAPPLSNNAELSIVHVTFVTDTLNKVPGSNMSTVTPSKSATAFVTCFGSADNYTVAVKDMKLDLVTRHLTRWPTPVRKSDDTMHTRDLGFFQWWVLILASSGLTLSSFRERYQHIRGMFCLHFYLSWRWVPAYQIVQSHITDNHNLNRIYVPIHGVFNDTISCSGYTMLHNRTSGKDVKTGNHGWI
jgi:hypothetical protein